ncbi:phage tail protein [Vibrio ostreicida]|uniref:Phage tail protein n=1 Tax=Vibrio ostreicida TaxID=526588 RepID=A0ABT8BW14_9VIBR|nr:phage tail protein [Vibrio ostreicida]MDN3611357.1 phage tail protein [Vibrio ostreicida]NPD09293.1 phage tail protein [Vibrio ostreicida]
MAQVMLTWSGFCFKIDTAAYNELVRKWQWRWSAQSRIGQSDLIQYTGKVAVKVSLKGEIAPAINSAGAQRVTDLARLGDEGQPRMLTSGLGDVLGYWVMTDLSETNTKFIQHGVPRRQSFALELTFYGDNLPNP